MKIKDNSEILKKAKRGSLTDSEFSVLMHNFLISEGGYVLDVGNNSMVNAEVALRLAEKINKHPLLWKLFFMVA